MERQPHRVVFLVCTVVTTAASAAREPAADAARRAVEALSRVEMQSAIEFLASDSLQGRAPGTAGGRLAEEYVKSAFQWMALDPGLPDGYLQSVPLRGFSVDQLRVKVNGVSLQRPDDVVLTYTGGEPRFAATAGAVFVGFGIRAAPWSWDDFKDVDVRGKFLIARVNDPGMLHPDIFEGRTLTYYGRWTYHIEEAVRRGARGILLIHTDDTAGYGWSVVENSWSRESLHLPSQLDNDLKYRGWIKESSLRKVLAATRWSLDTLYAQSASRDFHPVDLGFAVAVEGEARRRDVAVNNVVAQIPGRVSQRIVLSAHIDHLGTKAGAAGDNVFNGALDNASAVAAMLMTAKVLKALQEQRHFTVTLLACQAEESNLLGSRYFVENADRDAIVANINFESTPVWEKAKSIMGVGAGYTTFADLIATVAKREGWLVSDFSLTNQGLFYRSDQFPFAQWGIPAVWISAGEDDESGTARYTRFWSTDYHTVRDEFDPTWPLAGLRQTVLAAVRLVQAMDEQRSGPRWRGQPAFPMEVPLSADRIAPPGDRRALR